MGVSKDAGPVAVIAAGPVAVFATEPVADIAGARMATYSNDPCLRPDGFLRLLIRT